MKTRKVFILSSIIFLSTMSFLNAEHEKFETKKVGCSDAERESKSHGLNCKRNPLDPRCLSHGNKD